MIALALIACLALPATLADVITRIPDAAPAGFEEWESPIVLPAKHVSGDGDWERAVAKARAFVSMLTLEEKVNLTTGVGMSGQCEGNTGAVTRLAFPGFCLNDSPLGVRDIGFASAFPASINAAATFDKDLIYKRARAMGAEYRSNGANVALGPMTNMGRVAAGGRNWEGFGADPYLSGIATAETVKGYQDEGVIACVKHYIANEQEHFRGGGQAEQVYSSNIDDRTMHEVYVWPFADAVQAGVGSVMCSYNKINQTQACQNSKLINGILKEELNFQGFVLSDWTALINGVQPALAGTDMNMPGFKAYSVGPDEPDPNNTTNSWWGSALKESVKNGSVPETRLDDMVTRSMTAFFKLGQDKGSPVVKSDYHTEDIFSDGVPVNQYVDVQDVHHKLIREIGAASTILLKNNHVLPLDIHKIERIAVLGSDAGPSPNGPNGCSYRGCDEGTLAMGWGSAGAYFPYLIDPLSAIQSFVNLRKPMTTIQGVLNDFNYAQISSVASRADTCIVFVNSDSGEGYITVDGNSGDRTNLTLWHAGEALINATASVCRNTIVVQHVVGPVLVEAWIGHPNVTAVLHAGLPGQESGNAVVDILFGAVNPSGRLPYTIPKAREDYPADLVYQSNETTPQLTYKEALEIDYRHFDAHGIEPRFEFGFGMSYTTFTYHGLHVASSDPSPKRRADSVSGSSSDLDPSVALTSTLSNSTTKPSGTKPASSSSTPSVTTSTAAHNVSTTVEPIISATISGNTTATTTMSAPPVITSPMQTNPGGALSLFETAWTVIFSITNTGLTDGNEVSQVYLGFPPSASQPPRVLRGFDRSFIKAGSTKSVKLPLRKKDISVWDVVDQKWVIPSGTFTVDVGSSSRRIHLTGNFTPP